MRNIGVKLPAEIGHRYRLLDLIGTGSFGAYHHAICMGMSSYARPCLGKVYRSMDILLNQHVAIKVEHWEYMYDQLENEGEIYKELKDVVGFPAFHGYGQEGDINYLVLDLLGPSIKSLFILCGGRFSLKTAANVMLQMVSVDVVQMSILVEAYLIGGSP